MSKYKVNTSQSQEVGFVHTPDRDVLHEGFDRDFIFISTEWERLRHTAREVNVKFTEKIND